MDPDVQVMTHFVRAKGQFISGTAIAEALGLSRVSVHNRLESLRRSGFTFSAIRNRGYQLAREPDTFHPVLFNALMELEPCPFFKDYLLHEEVDSTNNIAEAQISGGRNTPFVVLATSQSAGRGRRGRVWHSPKGKNLYLSIALRPSMPPSRMQTITLWMGLRLCQFLREQFSLPVLVKWPNDLMLHGRKIAGMLTEARVDSEMTRDLVFGLGLNANAGRGDFPPDLQEKAGSLHLSLGVPVNLSRLAHQLLLYLADAFQDYLADAWQEELARCWPEFDYLRGQHIQTDGISGIAHGITSNGSLRVERDNGSNVVLHSGEVSLQK